MPSNYVKKVADEKNISLSKAEDYWKRAKKQASEQGHKEDYDYITSIFQSMVGISESEDPASYEHPIESVLTKPTLIEGTIYNKGTKILWQ